MQTKTRVAVVKVPVAKPGKQSPTAKPVFTVPRSTATALNNEPVNIVINPVALPTGVDPAQAVSAKTNIADLVVTSSGLRMRSEPSSRSNTLGNYARGAKFVLIRDQNGWALVQSLDDGQKGWMFKKFMAKEG